MRLLSVALLSILLSSCATYKPAVEKKVENERTFKAPYDKVWTKIVSFVSANGMNVKTIDKSSGLIGFERAYDSAFTSQFVDCGEYASTSPSPQKSGLRDPSPTPSPTPKPADENLKVTDGTVSMNFFVERLSEGETKVRINIFGRVLFPGATNLYGMQVSPGKAYSCYSKGTFEKLVFCEIQGTPCPQPTPSPTPIK